MSTVNAAAQILDFPLLNPEADARVLAQELALARRIQQSLLPKSFPELRDIALAGYCRSARQVGGDFYDVLPMDGETALVAIADVMGKGIPAALFATTLRTSLRTLAPGAKGPAELLARLNRLMFDELSSVDMFITAQLALVDARHRSLTLAGAGHCPLLLSPQPGVTEALSPPGPPLGVLREAMYGEEAVDFGPAACALLYTDGLTEARDSHGHFLGQSHLADWLCQGALRSEHPVETLARLAASLAQFGDGGMPDDDQTCVLMVSQAQRPSEFCEVPLAHRLARQPL